MSRRIPGLLLCLGCILLTPLLHADEKEPTFLDKKLSYWVEQLETGKDATARRRGAIAVEQIGPASKKVLPALVKALREDKESIVRQTAARGIGRTITKLIDLAQANKEDPPRLDTARDALASALRTDKTPEVREAAALAIGDLGSEARPVLGALSHALKDKHLPTMKAAALSLRRIGPAARGAQPELQALLADKKADKEARADAAVALGQIGGDVAALLPVFQDVLADSTTQVAYQKALAAARGKKVAREVEAEAKAEGIIRKAVADSLRKIGKDAADASAALGLVLIARESTPELRLAAVNALDQFGPEARAAIPALIKSVADPELIKTMGDNSRFIRGQAMHALGQMGKELDKQRKEAVTAILKATEDPSIEVCVSGIETLAAMELDGYGGLKDEVIKRLESIIRREGRKSIREVAEATLAKVQRKR